MDQIYEKYKYIVPLSRGSILKGYHSKEFVEDVESVGTIALLEAINKFDPDLGVSFKTYAYSCVRGQIFNFLRNNTHGPKKLNEHVNILRKASDVLGETLAREPNIEELAKYIGVSEDTVLVWKRQIYEAVQGEFDELGISEDPLDIVIGLYNNEELMEAIYELPEDDRKLILYTYFSSPDGPLPRADLAEILGKTVWYLQTRLPIVLEKLKNLLEGP